METYPIKKNDDRNEIFHRRDFECRTLESVGELLRRYMEIKK